MVPLKLSLKNFVSYGSTTQVVDFAAYSLICLSGKNGHGKSALLDAITWALWGQARKVAGSSKPDEGLMRLGQNHMMVSLDFSCNGNYYRVRREYTLATSKAHAGLEFGVIDPLTNIFRPLTDKTIRATQEKINLTLALDYDTFINSAFIRQGQSNEFSKKAPKDRKEILANILGLNHYELLRKRASDKAKEYSNQKEILRITHDRFVQELIQKPVLATQLLELKQHLEQICTQELACKQELMTVKQLMQQAHVHKQHYDQLLFQHAQVAHALQQDATHYCAQIKIYRAFLHKKNSCAIHKNLEQEYIHTQTQIQLLQNKYKDYLACKEEYLRYKELEQQQIIYLEKQYAQEKEQHTLLVQQARIILNTHEQKLQELTHRHKILLSEHAQVVKELKEQQTKLASTSVLDTLQQHEQQFEKRKAYYQKFLAQSSSIQNELKQTARRKELVTSCNEACCPLCQQPISAQRTQTLTHAFTMQEARLQTKLQKLNNALVKLKQLLIDQRSMLEQDQKNKAISITLTMQVQDLVKQQARLETEIKAIEQQKTTLLVVINNQNKDLIEKQRIQNENVCHYERRILEDQKFQELRNHRITSENQLASYLHEPEKERLLNDRLKEITQLQQEHAHMLKEIALQEQRKEVIASMRLVLKKRKREKQSLEHELNNYQKLAEQQSMLLLQEQNILTKLHAYSASKEQLLEQKGGIEQRYNVLIAQEEEQRKLAATLIELEQRIYEYQALTHALSKDGIQALLIEDTLPELEYEANNLLTRLTDNQAHITIESLRDLRNGSTKETLDINISDAIGIRPYELFSGGEAFRIDFALRIALSKLLSRRAGTALQTLIIDEGFGSQDEEGLSHIMQALHKIQEDFTKIIIVSHLPGMKEQFPVHFAVHKGPHGSEVKVIEHD